MYTSTSAFDTWNRRVYQSIAKNDVTSTLFYYYDPLNRVTEVHYTPNTSSASTYQVFQLHWLGNKIVAYSQTDYPGATLSKRYVVTDETNRPIEMWNWPSSGDTTRVWATNPDAYGYDVNKAGPTYYQPVLFAGQMIDPETTAYRSDGTTVHRPALVHNGYRTYDPFVGGYLQPRVSSLANTFAGNELGVSMDVGTGSVVFLVVGSDGSLWDCKLTSGSSVWIEGIGQVETMEDTCYLVSIGGVGPPPGGDGGGDNPCGFGPCPPGGGGGGGQPTHGGARPTDIWEPDDDDDPGIPSPFRDNGGYLNFQCIRAPCTVTCRNGTFLDSRITSSLFWTLRGAVEDGRRICALQAYRTCGPQGGWGVLDDDFCVALSFEASEF